MKGDFGARRRMEKKNETLDGPKIPVCFVCFVNLRSRLQVGARSRKVRSSPAVRPRTESRPGNIHEIRDWLGINGAATSLLSGLLYVPGAHDTKLAREWLV
ncbi:hypothetical protein RRG08_043281 [Elysia crispata]|uniref:Uncharacterized protein n=1 Tax=Elysia crispata TaxID=231223 RepID=A0AAE0XXJ3_9GAST|nr:hypothetical protein RRG08_043281 [Elysia crispata]